MLNTIFKILFITLLLWNTQCLGQSSSDNMDAQIVQNLDDLFLHCSKNNLFNGVVRISRKGETLYQKSFLENRHTNVALDENSSFLLASLSKHMTAMGIVYLHADGKLDYDDPVVQYLPHFPYKNITIRHLLNHTSGLPEYTEILNPRFDQFEAQYRQSGDLITNATIASMLGKFQPPLSFDPGSDFYYSNTGYVFLALLVEQISGQSFEWFMRETFFDPLELKNTFVRTLTYLRTDVVEAYKENLITGEIATNSPPEFFQVYGDGGIYSSVKDMDVWLQALDSGKFFDQSYLEEAYTSPTFDDNPLPYGFWGGLSVDFHSMDIRRSHILVSFLAIPIPYSEIWN